MYTALLIILLVISIYLFISGDKKGQQIRKYSGVVLGLATIVFFWFMDFWGEALWFEGLGYGNRFWTIVNSTGLTAIAGAVTSFILVFLLTFTISKKYRFLKGTARLAGVIAGAIWGVNNWEIIMKFIYGTSTGLKDPIIGQDVGFYLFSLPFYDALADLFIILSVVSIVVSFLSAFVRIAENKLVFITQVEGEVIDNKSFFPLFLNSGVFIFIMAAERFLSRYHLMYSTAGVASGMSWIDVNIILPATYVVIAILILLGITLLVPAVRIKFQNSLHRKLKVTQGASNIAVIGVAGITVVIIWILAFEALPKALSMLMVKPNEITYERPYILNNIEFTRYGFGLNKVEEKEYPMNGSLTQETINANPSLFSNIRLWDSKALDAAYRQFQSMRLYYEFSDIDVDRYTIDGKERQVMVSGREMNLDNLPQQSQTFVNKRFQYTHGYGMTMAGVNEFTPEGLPHLLIKDIPPASEFKSIEVKQPQIYFGELTTTPVVVNTKVKEFDYPSGEDNAYTNYAGKGGVEISNFWRKFLYGWKFDGTNFLFSDYPTDKSRILFHRQISERVKLLAPFLHFDKDPYLVLSNGKMYWMIDAYTTSQYFPNSQPYEGVNYIRNSVKAVIDAYDGSVDFYIMDTEDPIINVWNKIFPDLFKPKSEMPKDLQAHMRYPKDLLLTQGMVYAKYHMTDPTVFYNQEDLWVRATNKYYNETVAVDPYYIMWQKPGEKKQQFVLMCPYTPKNRQVLVGWIAGMCDAENYGKFVSYQFSKDKMILGPQQVESKIDQDSFLSGQLTLWDQHGSKVIRGNVLAIPVNNTLFYVEPIYLQSETAAYPELRLVVVMHGDNMSYAKSFDEALNGLFSKSPALQKTSAVTETAKTPITVSQLPGQIRAANEAFNNYLKLNADRKFTEAAKELEKLQQALQTLSNQSGEKKK